MSKPGKLFLIPSSLGEHQAGDMLAVWVKMQVHHLKYFLVESEKTGRAAIRLLQLAATQAELQLQLLNEHTVRQQLADLIAPLLEGHDMGLVSDAGLPCIADPGSEVVAMAHRKNIEVVPLPGPSSLMQALMASGMNGQGFTFHGYLPVEKGARAKRVRELEQEAQRRKHTQLFIETPYRNNQLLADILKHCQASTRLCIAVNLLQPQQQITTATIGEWRQKTVDLHKQPAVFLIGA